MVVRSGIDKDMFTAHHNKKIGKIMAHATVDYCFTGSPEAGGESCLIGLHRSPAYNIAQRAHTGKGEISYAKGDAILILVDCNVTGSDPGTPTNPKFALQTLLWEHALILALESLVAPGGRCEGAAVVHQEDNAGPHNAGPHKEDNYHKWLQNEFGKRGWKLELQAPQGPYTNVLDLQVFPAMSKRHS